MDATNLIRVLADHFPLPFVMTGPDLSAPGPIILHVNPAFERMAGYPASELIGRSPRMLQGPRTSLPVRRQLLHALTRGQRFHGTLTNYRKSGESYLCEIDVRPVFNAAGQIEAFVAFEREVIRRRGRPSSRGRFVAVEGMGMGGVFGE